MPYFYQGLGPACLCLNGNKYMEHTPNGGVERNNRLILAAGNASNLESRLPDYVDYRSFLIYPFFI